MNQWSKRNGGKELVPQAKGGGGHKREAIFSIHCSGFTFNIHIRLFWISRVFWRWNFYFNNMTTRQQYHKVSKYYRNLYRKWTETSTAYRHSSSSLTALMTQHTENRGIWHDCHIHLKHETYESIELDIAHVLATCYFAEAVNSPTIDTFYDKKIRYLIISRSFISYQLSNWPHWFFTIQ